MSKPYIPDPDGYFSMKTNNKNRCCLTCGHTGCIIRKDGGYVCTEYQDKRQNDSQQKRRKKFLTLRRIIVYIIITAISDILFLMTKPAFLLRCIDGRYLILLIPFICALAEKTALDFIHAIKEEWAKPTEDSCDKTP